MKGNLCRGLFLCFGDVGCELRVNRLRDIFRFFDKSRETLRSVNRIGIEPIRFTQGILKGQLRRCLSCPFRIPCFLKWTRCPFQERKHEIIQRTNFQITYEHTDMRRLLLLLSFCYALLNAGLAQHNPNKTMFVFNKLQLNPGYAGSKNALTVGAHYRHQWQGVLGAPRTVSAFAHTPIAGNRSGVGLSITADEIGIFNTVYSNLAYAYKIGFKNDTRLSLGFNTQFEFSRFDWSKAELIDQVDATIPFDQTSASAINFGLGLYYEGNNFFVGASIPQMLRNSITSELYNNFSQLNPLQTYYLMGGYVFYINKNISIKPSLLVSYLPNAPFEADMNLSVLFLETFWVGASYRLEEAASLFIQVPVMKGLTVALGADYALSDINQFTKGSFELMLGYTLSYEDDKVNNIRFF